MVNAATEATAAKVSKSGATDMDAMMQVTVIRPSVVYGPNEALLNRLAQVVRV